MTEKEATAGSTLFNRFSSLILKKIYSKEKEDRFWGGVLNDFRALRLPEKVEVELDREFFRFEIVVARFRPDHSVENALINRVKPMFHVFEKYECS